MSKEMLMLSDCAAGVQPGRQRANAIALLLYTLYNRCNSESSNQEKFTRLESPKIQEFSAFLIRIIDRYFR